MRIADLDSPRTAEGAGRVGDTFVLPEHRILFVSIAKNACTAVKWALADISGQDRRSLYEGYYPEPTRRMMIHQRRRWHGVPELGDLSPEQLRQIGPDNGWFVFAVVRDPRLRLWSAWQNKFLVGDPAYTHQRFAASTWLPRTPQSSVDVLTDWAAFVNVLGSGIADDPARDRHFVSQTRRLHEQVIPYSRVYEIGEMGELTKDLEAHLERVGAPQRIDMPRENDTPLRAGREVFENGIRERIEALYAPDMRRFGHLWPFDDVMSRSVSWSADALRDVAMRRAMNERVADLHRTTTQLRGEIRRLRLAAEASTDAPPSEPVPRRRSAATVLARRMAARRRRSAEEPSPPLEAQVRAAEAEHGRAQALQPVDPAEAAATYERAISLHPAAPPSWHHELGLVRRRLEQWPAAERSFAAAVAADPGCPPDWYVHLGHARAAQRNHADALTAYRTALSRQPDAPAGWHYRAGASYEAIGRVRDAAREYAAWLDARPGTTDLERRLLAAGPHELGARRTVAEFLVDAIGGIRAAAGRHSAVVEDRSDTIFTYWGQGLDDAPPVVRMCHGNLVEHSSRPVVSLDDASLDRYVQMPGDIAASPMTRTQRSDFLRLELLSRYGGTWVDATCLFLKDPADPLARLGANGFFAFTKRDRTVGTWLIHSEPDGYLVRLFREALYAVWRKFGRNPHYFTIQHVFEVLTLVDDRFRQGWEAMPRKAFTAPLAFRHAITDPYDPDRYQDLLTRSFVTKLTYKYDEAEVTPDTMLGHLLAEHGRAGAGTTERS